MIGGFCDVCTVRRKTTGTIYVTKIFRNVCYDELFRDTSTSNSFNQSVQHEITILKRCRHENIVSYYGCLPYSAESNKLCIIMDYCANKSVKSLLQQSNECLLERHIAYIVRCVLLALQYLHSGNIVHRDIKAANILLTESGRVRLADFSISTYNKLHATQTNTVNTTNITHTHARGSSSDIVDDTFIQTESDHIISGSPLWMPPESFTDVEPTVSGDIWSLGITILELLHGEPPHYDIKSLPLIAAKIVFNPVPTFNSYTTSKSNLNQLPPSPALVNFLSLCLNKDPSERAAVSQLLQHHFITGTLQSVCSTHDNIHGTTQSCGNTFLGPIAEIFTAPDDEFQYFVQHKRYYIPNLCHQYNDYNLLSDDNNHKNHSGGDGNHVRFVSGSPTIHQPNKRVQNYVSSVDDSGNHLRKKQHLLDRQFSMPQSSPPVRRTLGRTQLDALNEIYNHANDTLLLKPPLHTPFAAKRTLSIDIPNEDNDSTFNNSNSFIISTDGTYSSGGFSISIYGDIMESPNDHTVYSPDSATSSSDANSTDSSPLNTNYQFFTIPHYTSTDSRLGTDISPIHNLRAQLQHHNSTSTTSDSTTEAKSLLCRLNSRVRLNRSDIVTLTQVGRGQNGAVYKALHLPSLTRVALKNMSIHSQSARHQLAKEFATYKAMNDQCKYLTTLFGAFFDNGSIRLASQYMDAGSLQQFVQTHCRANKSPQSQLSQQSIGLPEPILLAIIKQIVLGVEFMHNRHQLHRDIKPDNILLDHNLNVKINDFGLCTDLHHTGAMTDTWLGSFSYMSPERVISQSYGFPSDIWAIGKLCVYCATAPDKNKSAQNFWSMIDCAKHLQIDTPSNDITIPLSNRSQSTEVKSTTQSQCTSQSDSTQAMLHSINQSVYSAELIDFIQQCLAHNEELRPTASELLQHPLLRDVSVSESTLKLLTAPKYWVDVTEMNTRDLHTMLLKYKQHMNAQTCKLNHLQVQALSVQFGVDIYTCRQMAQAAEITLIG